MSQRTIRSVVTITLAPCVLVEDGYRHDAEMVLGGTIEVVEDTAKGHERPYRLLGAGVGPSNN